jgi:acetyl-CoA carboxylase biotin carboxyl carrier protein
VEEIRKLMEALENSSLKKLIVKESGGLEIYLEKESAQMPLYSKMPSQPETTAALETKHHFDRSSATEEKASQLTVDYITSPLVGTFFTAPSPDDPAFVKVGDTVDENTVVCIIEAMKVMNEVKAGKKGTVKEILVENAQPVEFGTKLFVIE